MTPEYINHDINNDMQDSGKVKVKINHEVSEGEYKHSCFFL